MKKYLLILVCALAPSWALATVATGLVSGPLVTIHGFGIFGMTGSYSFTGTKPACATNPVGSHWAINITTPTGRTMWAAVLQAHALGKNVVINGKGVCDAWGDRETVDYVLIGD
jgi:hypothetical protein